MGQSYITCRWVLTEKEDGFKKARLVARGFEDAELNPAEKQSPTCSKELLRCLLTFSATKGWKLHSIDIKAAFLPGEHASRTVTIRPPKEAETPKLWLLNKCVYGLADASLKWYQKVLKLLTSLGCAVSSLDRSIFSYNQNNNFCGFLGVHVDDFIWVGTQKYKIL